MLVYCWSSVADAGPTLNQHWFNILCFSGAVADKQASEHYAILPRKSADYVTTPSECKGTYGALLMTFHQDYIL